MKPRTSITPGPWLRFRRRLGLPFVIVAASATVWAHTVEKSYVRIARSSQNLAVAVAFDFAALEEFVAIDANRDGTVTRDELAAIVPAVEALLRQSICIRCNDQPVPLGKLMRSPWPVQAGAEIDLPDFHRYLAVFRFELPARAADGEVSLGVGYLDRVGPGHTVLASFAVQGPEVRAIITRSEPVCTFRASGSPPPTIATP